jgi:hypothetical protein
MSSSVYEFIGTRNAKLAKFTDDNPNIAAVIMKLVLHLENIAREWNRNLEGIDFDVKASPDGEMVLIKLRRK